MPSEINNTAREMRTIRIEDWLGNVYKPEGVGSGGGGGQSIGGGDIGESGSNTTEGTKVGDPMANGSTAIILPAPATGTKNLATVHFDNVVFGKYSVNIRAKTTRATPASDTDILIVNVYYVDNTKVNPEVKVSQTMIKERHFKEANKYVDIGFVTDFNGLNTTSISMKVEVLINGGTGVTITFDSVSVSKAYVAVTGTPTIVTN